MSTENSFSSSISDSEEEENIILENKIKNDKEIIQNYELLKTLQTDDEHEKLQKALGKLDQPKQRNQYMPTRNTAFENYDRTKIGFNGRLNFKKGQYQKLDKFK